MKTSQDPRHKQRTQIVKDLFAQSYHKQAFTSPKTRQILARLSEIDPQIQSAAPEWPLGKVAKVDLAILRLAVYELTLTKQEPPKVIIDEAVELAKEFGSETSSSFINGVLGTIIKKMTNS